MAPGNWCGPRGRGGCSCSLGTCCTLFFIIFFLLIILVPILWHFLGPDVMKVRVIDASLNQFDLTNDNKLHYNLTLNITMRNANKKTRIYYDRFEATADYHHGKIKLGYFYLSPFYQGRKNTTTPPQLVFQGQASVPQRISSKVNEHFSKDKGDGSFDINIRIHLKIRYKIGGWTIGDDNGEIRPKVKCNLRIPLKTLVSNQTVTRFQPMNCKVEVVYVQFE